MFLNKILSRYQVTCSKPRLGEIEHLLHYMDVDIPFTRGYAMGDKDIVLAVPPSWKPEGGMSRLNEDLEALVSQMDGFRQKWNIRVWHENDPRLKDHGKVEIRPAF